MASTQLTKTFSGNGSATTHTISMWVKRSKLDSIQRLFFTGSGSNQYQLYFLHLSGTYDNLLQFEFYDGSTNYYIRTNRQFKDTSAWYHIVAVWDTTNSTAGDRMRLYINGVEETSFAAEQQPTQNFNGYCNQSTYAHRIGASDTGHYFDGLITHVHSIDGTAYTPSAFGSTDATTGEWKINTSPSVTYGTNGFFILKDGSSVTDQSGNGNNFTVATGTLTNTEDCPSNVFATLNSLNNYLPEATFSNGNLKITTKESAPVMATIGASSGKYYWEVKVNALASNYGTIGIVGTQATASTQFITSNANEYMYYSPGSLNYNGGSVSSGYASYTAGDIIGVAMDLDNNRLFFSKNGTFQNSADPTSSTGAYTITAPASTSLGLYSPAIGYWDDNDAANGTYEVNFGNGFFGTTAISSEGTNASGNGKFEYDVPTGYTALSTKGLNL